MRIGLLLRGAAAAGALFTYLFLGDREAPAPGASAGAVDTDGPAQDAPAPELLTGGQPPPPKVEIQGTGGVSIVADKRMDTARMIKEVQKAFSEKLYRSQARVAQLEGQIASRDALPKPEVVQDLERARVHELVVLVAEIKDAAGKRLLTPPAHLKLFEMPSRR